MPAFLVALVAFFSACSGAWGQSKGDILRSLERRDYAMFDGIDASRYAEAAQLGDEAPYFIGLHLRLAGREEQARIMFEVGYSSSPEPYSGMCLREMAGLGYQSHGDVTPAQRLSAVELLIAALPASPDTDADVSVKLANLVETRDRLRILSGKHADVKGGAESWLLDRAIDAELALVVADSPADSYSPDFLAVHAIRAAVAMKDYSGAWESSRLLLSAERLNPCVWRRGSLSDIGKAALYGSSTPEADALFLSRLVPPKNADRSLLFLPVFYSARLYAKAERPAKARTAFLKSIAASKKPRDRDSACWYLLDLDIKYPETGAGFGLFFADYRAYALESGNPAWYNDLLESLTVSLVNARDWKGVEALRVMIPTGVDPELRARLGYIAARTALAGTAKATGVLEEIASLRRDAPYYALMASVALSASGQPVAADVVAPAAEFAPVESDADAASYALLHAYIDWFLPERLYQAAVDLEPSPSPQIAVKLGKELSSMGRHGDAIRLLSFSVARSGVGSGARSGVGDISAFELMLYPRPWESEVSASARRNNLDDWLLFALIRSESLFQPTIISGAGARGLSQLMEATAADIARELKIPSYDLADPATNIEFGAYYLSRMITRLEGQVLPACYAYNAGITRVRRWFAALEGLPPDIALEGLPFAETREYGRKIIVAAAVYGRLYYDKAPGDVVSAILGAAEPL